jgi:hypothetical protein
MPRARGVNAALAAVFESTYGAPPGTGFGREPLAPVYDVITNTGDLVVPVDTRNIGVWLRGLMGAPTTVAANAATGTITLTANLVVNDTVTIDGTVYTAVASGATGQQFNLGGPAALTATALAAIINPSANVAAAAVGTVVTLTAKALGPGGNARTLATNAPTRVTVGRDAVGRRQQPHLVLGRAGSALDVDRGAAPRSWREAPGQRSRRSRLPSSGRAQRCPRHRPAAPFSTGGSGWGERHRLWRARQQSARL